MISGSRMIRERYVKKTFVAILDISKISQDKQDWIKIYEPNDLPVPGNINIQYDPNTDSHLLIYKGPYFTQAEFITRTSPNITLNAIPVDKKMTEVNLVLKSQPIEDQFELGI